MYRVLNGQHESQTTSISQNVQYAHIKFLSTDRQQIPPKKETPKDQG